MQKTMLKEIKKEQLKHKINKLSFAQFKELWNYTEQKLICENIFYIRSAMLDRLEALNHNLYIKWLDSLEPEKDLNMFKKHFIK